MDNNSSCYVQIRPIVYLGFWKEETNKQTCTEQVLHKVYLKTERGSSTHQLMQISLTMVQTWNPSKKGQGFGQKLVYLSTI